MTGHAESAGVKHAENAGVKLSAILAAELPMPRGYVYRAPGSRLSRLRAGLSFGADALLAPALAYVVDHPSAGPVPIDTGLHPEALTNLRRDFGVPMSIVFGRMRPVAPFDVQLRELGIEPQSVERAIMTHLHVDHTSGMRLLPSARFTCSQAEWDATGMTFPARAGYVRHHLPLAERMDLLDFAARGEPYGRFEKTIDFLGDGAIRLLYTPGHTRGHVSVLLRLDDGVQVLIVGDAAYTLRSIEDAILPMLTDDDATSLRTLRALKDFAKQHPAAILVPSHDPEAWHALRDVATVLGAAADTSFMPGRSSSL